MALLVHSGLLSQTIIGGTQAADVAQLVEEASNLLPRDRRCHELANHLTRVVIDHIQHPEAAMPEQARSAEHPSEPKAKGLTAFIDAPSIAIDSFS
jgi:hypothetical protein